MLDDLLTERRVFGTTEDWNGGFHANESRSRLSCR
jgi:hypothetical protein